MKKMIRYSIGLFAFSLLAIAVSEQKFEDKNVAITFDKKTSYSRELNDYSINYFKSRNKRDIIGTDTRFQLNLNSYSDVFPFSTVVHFSTGCSGTLITQTHVLTSASCFHNGVSFKRGSRKAKVGKYVHHQESRDGYASPASTSQPSDQMVWTTIQKIHLPTILTSNALRKRRGVLGSKQRRRRSRLSLTPGYNFAVVQLKEKLPGHSMPVGIATEEMGRLHLTSYNFYENHKNRIEKTSDLARLSYRFCDVTHFGKEVLWNNCDADDRSANGAGIYVMSTSREPNVKIRQLVAIYTANFQNNNRVRSNQAVRITAFKRGQICLWVNEGDPSRCGGFELPKTKTNLPRSARTFKNRLPGRRPTSRTEFRKYPLIPAQKGINKSSYSRLRNLNQTLNNSYRLKSNITNKTVNLNETSSYLPNFPRKLAYRRKVFRNHIPKFRNKSFRKNNGYSTNNFASKHLQGEKRRNLKLSQQSPKFGSKPVGNLPTSKPDKSIQYKEHTKLNKRTNSFKSLESQNSVIKDNADSLKLFNQNGHIQKTPGKKTSTFIAFKRPKFKRKNLNLRSKKNNAYST